MATPTHRNLVRLLAIAAVVAVLALALSGASSKDLAFIAMLILAGCVLKL